jgi:hypothetical protein
VPFTGFEFKSEVANFQIIFTIAKPIQSNGSLVEIEASKLVKSEIPLTRMAILFPLRMAIMFQAVV